LSGAGAFKRLNLNFIKTHTLSNLIMKNALKHLLAAGALAALASTASAAIVVGDTIVIDFTKSGAGTSGNWNNIQEADGGTDGFDDATGITSTVVATDLIRFSDGAGTGVGLRADGLDSGTTNIGIGGLDVSGTDSTAAFAVSGAIPSSAQLDVTFHVNGETQFVFTGLNSSLTYDLSFQSWAGTAGRDTVTWVINPGQTDETTLVIDSNDSNPSVYTVAGLSADASDQIILRSTTFGGSRIGHINALELTAVPEPSTYALLAGFVTLGAVMLRRRLKD